MTNTSEQCSNIISGTSKDNYYCTLYGDEKNSCLIYTIKAQCKADCSDCKSFGTGSSTYYGSDHTTKCLYDDKDEVIGTIDTLCHNSTPGNTCSSNDNTGAIYTCILFPGTSTINYCNSKSYRNGGRYVTEPL